MKQEDVETSSLDGRATNPFGVRGDHSPPPLPAECNLPADQIRYSCAPPISQPANSDKTERNQLLVSRTLRSRKSLSSTSWLSSITLHLGAVLLLALVFVPADFGGMSTLSILLTSDQHEPQENLVVFEQGVSEQHQPPDATLQSISTSVPDQLLGGHKSLSVHPNKSAGPRGSFFGINSDGHEFVYVLDMSTSMEGGRFDRASAELMRSVEQLGPNQRFFVMLFCSKTRQMFDRSDYLPESVIATRENKERLANWLRSTSLAGGTDPREALEVAMRMKPSAIFILSDGEFNGHKQQKQQRLLGGNSDVVSIVEAASAKPPIHSIAFEDEKSQENMRQLAELTAGQFRFVGRRDVVSREESIKYVRTALLRGDLAMAELFIREVVANLAETAGEDSNQSKVELARILFDFAENELKKGDFDAARRALVTHAHIYPKDEMIEELQATLVGSLLNRLNSDPDGAADVPSLLTEFVKKFPKSTAAKCVYRVGQSHLDEARRLYASGEYLPSIRKLEKVIATFPEWASATNCQGERDRIAEELLDQARVLRQQQGNAPSVLHLRHLVTLSKGTQFQQQVILALETLAKEMLVEVRDANYSKDWTTRDSIQQELNEGFGDDPLLIRIYNEFVLNEQRAQEIFQRAIKLEKPRQVTTALAHYRSIVKDFSDTRAAQMAKQRMRMFGQLPE